VAATPLISQERTAVRHYRAVRNYRNPIPGMRGRMPRRSFWIFGFSYSCHGTSKTLRSRRFSFLCSKLMRMG